MTPALRDLYCCPHADQQDGFVVGWDAQLQYLADEVSKATPLDKRRPKASSNGTDAQIAASCTQQSVLSTMWAA